VKLSQQEAILFAGQEPMLMKGRPDLYRQNRLAIASELAHHEGFLHSTNPLHLQDQEPSSTDVFNTTFQDRLPQQLLPYNSAGGRQLPMLSSDKL